MNDDQNIRNSFLKRYFKFRSSIYSQVLLIITILSIILFVLFGLIFQSVNENYMASVIRQNGSNISLLVEGALYQSMLKNDNTTLQNTLEIINTLPGISDVNMYDSEDNLVHTSSSYVLAQDSINRYKSNCKMCHSNIGTMFHKTEKSYKIINTDTDCEMNQHNDSHRHLFVKAPILNQPSCYTSECHAHKQTDVVLGSLIVKIPLKELDTVVTKSTADFFVLATISTLILVLILFFFTRRKIKKPLTAILNASRSVANGVLSTRLNTNEKQLDDMKIVSEAFNNMLDKLDSANKELQNWSNQLEYKVEKKSEELKKVHNELIHVERMASLGKLSLSVAHEINNPLSGVLTYAKLIQKQLKTQNINIDKKETLLKHLNMIEKETKRCGEIVKGLLDFSRKDQKDFVPISLHSILDETHSFMVHNFKVLNINIIKKYEAEEDIVKCSQNQIKQAFLAILVNATEAIINNGEIKILTKNLDRENILIEITDNGNGITEADMKHIFEPFFSNKDGSNGIGLGLAVVHGIVKSHNGKVDVRSKPGVGTTMLLSFPLHNNRNN